MGITFIVSVALGLSQKYWALQYMYVMACIYLYMTHPNASVMTVGDVINQYFIEYRVFTCTI